jgi:hypothetical protein
MGDLSYGPVGQVAGPVGHKCQEPWAILGLQWPILCGNSHVPWDGYNVQVLNNWPMVPWATVLYPWTAWSCLIVVPWAYHNGPGNIAYVPYYFPWAIVSIPYLSH